ncbi:PA0061/PA0062 family lipoprotein [Pseudomonas sp. RT6P73]
MRRLMLLLAASVVAGCQSPLPAVNPQMAWIEFSTPFPNYKLLMAERLDKQRMRDGRFFQVTPGSHELVVRFDFEVPGGGGMGMMSSPVERLCYLTINYDHFEAGQRYVLEGRSIAFTPGARLFNAKREIVAEDRQAYCVP